MINEYPRPQFRRDSYYCLNGIWQFAVSESTDFPDVFPETILVPYPPESENSCIHRRIKPSETMYYRTIFTLPKDFKEDRVLLHFGGVDQICEVFLNGILLGKHEGGYLPFYFDISESLQDINELIVKATDSLDHKYPWGKQRSDNGGMWYTPFSGIWQTVWIENVPSIYLKSVRITPSLSSVQIDFYDSQPGCFDTTLTIISAENTCEWSFSDNSVSVPISNPHHWTPEDPFLYKMIIRRGRDLVYSYFALRTISISESNGIPRILLNGKPYFFHGLLDQGYWEKGLCIPDSDNGYDKDILYAKSLGFNMLRKHIRIEPLPFYEACDRIGMIVFQDFVNNGPHRYFRDTLLPNFGFVYEDDKKRKISPEVKKIFKDTMIQTVSHLYNSPCIAYWTIFNEGWGQFQSDAMYELLKATDNTRVIDSTSGWFWQSKSDVDSYHLYFTKLKQFGGKRPLVLSEFGGYSYNTSGNRYGYKFFKTKEEYKKAVANLYYHMIIPSVKKGLCASVYTQLSDVEDEQNGLITYDRTVQKFTPEDLIPISQLLSHAILTEDFIPPELDK